jgi:hypothetical protein
MKRTLALVALFVASLGAQTAPPATRIQLFLIERPVGFETATTVSTAEGRTATSEMELVDRGTRLQLSASLSVAPDGTARHFRASGKSYRFVNVDAEVTVTGNTARVMTMGETTEVAVPAGMVPGSNVGAGGGARIAHRLLGKAQTAVQPGAAAR